MKKARERKFGEEDVKSAIFMHFELKDKNYFFDTLKELIDRYTKCITVKKEYIETEKYQKFF